MASSLQCIDAIKKRSRTPSSRNIEATVVSPLLQDTRERRERESKNKLYSIEIVEEGAFVKVHYRGYESKYDEWKRKEEVVLMKPSFSVNTEIEWSPITELACSIKKCLLPSQSEDPDVRIQISCVHVMVIASRCCRGRVFLLDPAKSTK